MTYEEAIRKIDSQKLQFLEDYVDYSGISEAYDMAIEALEKQIPKKPIEVDSNSNESRYRCPACGEIQWDSEGFTFEYPSCRCGQRLNWNLIWSDEK